MPQHTNTTAPLFVVASARSGTTLLGLMLGGHPELAWAGELDFMVADVADDGDLPGVDAFAARVRRQRMFRALEVEIDRSLGYRDLMRSFLDQRMRAEGKPRVGGTVHERFHRLPLLYPDARYVHLVRDGRDVAASCMKMGWAGNMYTAADRWIDSERSWEILQRHVPEERRMTIRFESLVQDPASVLGRIARFYGLEYHPDMLRYPESSTYAPPDPSLAEQWRRTLHARDVRLGEARMAHLLSARGYALSGQPPLPVSLLQDRLLRVHDKVVRTRFRYRRYGALLAGADFVTRRLHLWSLYHPVRQRMDTIETAHLQ